MKVVFLGTGSMIPTKERNHSAILVSHKIENILIDCGEGTQRQLRILGFAPPKLTRILITHWHGDHYYGLAGVIENLGKNQYSETLQIYGPRGSKNKFNKIANALGLKDRIKMKVNEINKDGLVFENESISIGAYYLKHSIPCIGYYIKEADVRKINLDYIKRLGIPEGPVLGNLQKGKDIMFQGKKIKVKNATYIKKGKKAAIIMDTAVCGNCHKLAKDSDLLICDSTYHSDLKDKAKDYMHLTSEQAAMIAKKANAKRLVLTHFSQRYKDVEELEKEAKNIFRNTASANDFFSVEV